MKFSARQIITLIKGSPEKIISWLLLTIFISLSSYLAISWLKKTPSFSLEGIGGRQGERKPLNEAAVLVDFGGLLTRKPITYYVDIAQRNPFSNLPPAHFLTAEQRRVKKLNQIEALLTKLKIVGEYREYYDKYLFREYTTASLPGLDPGMMEKEQRNLTEMEGDPDRLEKFLIEIRERGREKIEIPVEELKGLYYCGKFGTQALIEGKKAYWVEEGEEVEGWKVKSIEEDKVVLYKEEDKKELILLLGAKREEMERRRKIKEEEEGKSGRRRIEEEERAKIRKKEFFIEGDLK